MSVWSLPSDPTVPTIEPTRLWGILAGLCLTALFHGALIAGYMAWEPARPVAAPVEEEEPVLLHFEVAELLMWGEVMPPEGGLPSIPNPAPDEAPPEVVSLRPPASEDSVVVPHQREVRDDRPIRHEEPYPDDVPRDSSRHDPNRPVNREPLWGSPYGFRGGTSLSPSALANLFGPAQAQIQNAFRPPAGLSPDQLASLGARVHVWVNEDGRIVRYRFMERSGNRLYDAAIERALNTFRLGSQRLLLPRQNERVMAQVLEHGFVVTVTP